VRDPDEIADMTAGRWSGPQRQLPVL